MQRTNMTRRHDASLMLRLTLTLPRGWLSAVARQHFSRSRNVTFVKYSATADVSASSYNTKLV